MIEFTQVGEGSEVIVFLHGWNNDSSTWLPLTKQFNKSEYSIYLLDLPGFGASEIPKKVLTLNDYANEVEKFMASQELKNVTVVGHSFGGRIGIVLASHKSNNLQKLVLIGTPGIPIELSLKNKMLRFTVNLFKIFTVLIPSKLMANFKKRIRKRIYGDDYIANTLMMDIRNQAIEQDLTKNISRISVPTLIIYGEEDSEYPDIVARKMNKLIPNSRLSVFSYASHFIHLQKPQIILKMIEDFIND